MESADKSFFHLVGGDNLVVYGVVIRVRKQSISTRLNIQELFEEFLIYLVVM